MKKNILLVQSLLILPLISSSYIFSMDQEKTYAIAVKGTQLGQPNQLKQSGTKKRKKKAKQQTQTTVAIATEQAATPDDEHAIKAKEEIAVQQDKDYFTDVDAISAKEDLKSANNRINETPGLEDLLLAIRSLSMGHGLNPVVKTTTPQETIIPVDMNTIKITVSEDLENSVLSPSEYKSWGLTESFLNVFKSYRQIVINQLKNETFETNNAAHTEYFNKALEECAQYKDKDALANMLNACQTKEQYKPLQSAINHVAPAFNFLCDEYQAQITQSNTALTLYNQQCATQINEESALLKEKIAQLLTQHRNKVTGLANDFETKVKEEQQKAKELQLLIANVSALNIRIKNSENRLLFALPLSIPNNHVKAIEEATHQNVRHLLTHANMPQAQVVALQIDNK